MSSWFMIIILILLISPSFLKARSRADSKRRYSVPTVPFVPPPPFPFDDDIVYGSNVDPWSELATTTTTIKPLKLSKYRANEQQIEQFTRLLFDRLNLKEPPNVTDGTDFPSSIVKQLEQQTKEQQHIHHNEELNSYQQQKNRDEIQATTERAILPGDYIPHHTCQRQVAAIQMNRKNENFNHIDCFRFTKSSTDSSKGLPTNQMIKQLRIYVKKNYFYFNDDQHDVFTSNMFQIYQVYRPTSNDTLQYPFNDLTGTIRVTINHFKQLSDNWFELTVDPNNQQISIQKLYQQFITPWYGLAIDRQLQSSWSPYKRHYSKKHIENFLRPDDDDEDDNNKETQQHPYMLVEYGDKIPSSSSGNRGTRAVPARPARPCDPKSPCCRRSLTIDLDQGNNALNFVIYPRQLDIGECIGVCGGSGSSLKHTDAKNEKNAGYNLFLLHANGIHKNATTQNNRSDQQSTQCCSYSRTGGLELMYTTTNGGPIIRKFIPNMVVEECRCGLPATIQQV
jgi:hypothetical protein